MRVVIIADALFASRERPLLERLEVGLADEGVRVIHAVPEEARGTGTEGLYSRALRYTGRSLALTRPLQAMRLAGAIDAIDEAEGGAGINLVHAFGGSVWKLARGVAEHLRAGVALEVWRSGLVPEVPSKLGASGVPAMLLTPDTAIERLLVAHVGTDLRTRCCRWGVHAPLQPRTVLQPSRTWTAALVGAGLDAGAYAAALRGLAVAAGVRPDMHVFADAVAARRAGLWAVARQLGLLDRLSLIEELEGRRDLLMQADVLVLPEARGDQRSVLLEAMATGVVVVAAADPLVTALQDGRTARLVTDHAAWGAAFSDILTNEARTHALTLNANEYVRTNARVSDYVRGVLAAYQSLAPDSALPFTGKA